MSLTYTPSFQAGQPCPDFQLKAVDGKTYHLSQFSEAKALVVLFLCNHCPYVQAIEDRIIRLYKEMKPLGVEFIGICSNDPTEYPEDRFENLKKRWIEKKYLFPYLHDPTQEVARQFEAVCTPDIFVYKNKDSQFQLFYRGRLDDSWKNEKNVKTQELKLALEDLLKGRDLQNKAIPSMGCSIKWIS